MDDAPVSSSLNNAAVVQSCHKGRPVGGKRYVLGAAQLALKQPGKVCVYRWSQGVALVAIKSGFARSPRSPVTISLGINPKNAIATRGLAKRGGMAYNSRKQKDAFDISNVCTSTRDDPYRALGREGKR